MAQVLAIVGTLTFSQRSFTKSANFASSVKSSEIFEKDVRPVLNGRCIACHSCYDSPCQLNLQSATGLFRGAFGDPVYNGSRLKPAEPTRIYEDAQTLRGWHDKGFYSVMTSDPVAPAVVGRNDEVTNASPGPTESADESSIFLKMIELTHSRDQFPTQTVRENRVCVASPKAAAALREKPELGMPYGLPALSKNEEQTLHSWAESVRHQPDQELHALSLIGAAPALKKQAKSWEAFLNTPDLEHKIVARYIFEHLFLGHFMTPGIDDQHLKLVRSSTRCEQSVTPVSARHSNSDPGVASWSYCFYLDPSTTVYKNHIVYPISTPQLAWLKSNFFKSPWKATEFPSFKDEIATNPFKAFNEVPILARDRFLLHDSRFFVMTFIKGPVCNGSVAVNVIQAQFYVFFQDPKHDLMVTDPGYAAAATPLMNLPGQFDDDHLLEAFKDYKRLAEWHNKDLDLKIQTLKQHDPNGYGLDGIWDGDGVNPNALLTVLRHDDNAAVEFGARGDLPKTVFVLDYSIFERIVYNLVVNYDVFGNVKHQSLTRLDMDFLRMGAEDNYLAYLPADYRLSLKKSWYEGALTNKKLKLLHEFDINQTPTSVAFGDEKTEGSFHLQLIKQLLWKRLNEKTRGPTDEINWKKIASLYPKDNVVENEIAKIASVSAVDATPFARFFPENSLLVIAGSPALSQAESIETAQTHNKVVLKDKLPLLYSILHNREHQNVSWMFAEDDRLLPEQDTLTIEPGIMGGYVNQFFRVNERDLPVFIKQALAIKNKSDYQAFEKTFAVARDSLDFWPNYDLIQKIGAARAPREFGILDLSRLAMKKDARELPHLAPYVRSSN